MRIQVCLFYSPLLSLSAPHWESPALGRVDSKTHCPSLSWWALLLRSFLHTGLWQSCLVQPMGLPVPKRLPGNCSHVICLMLQNVWVCAGHLDHANMDWHLTTFHNLRMRVRWVGRNFPDRATVTRPRHPAEWSRNMEMVLSLFLRNIVNDDKMGTAQSPLNRCSCRKQAGSSVFPGQGFEHPGRTPLFSYAWSSSFSDRLHCDWCLLSVALSHVFFVLGSETNQIQPFLDIDTSVEGDVECRCFNHSQLH